MLTSKKETQKEVKNPEFKQNTLTNKTKEN